MEPQKPLLQSDYDFIMNSSQKKRGLGFGGGSSKNRIVIILVGTLILIVTIFVFLNLVGAPKRRLDAQISDLAAYQTELSRIIALGVDNSASVEVKAAAQTAAITLSTDLVATLDLMKNRDIKPNQKELAKYKSTSTDKVLEDAKKANNFDSTYRSLYEEKLTAYQQRLKSVYEEQKGATTRQNINNFYNHAVLLSFDYQPPTK